MHTQARTQKALGASLEARVALHTADPALAAALGRLNGADNAVDALRYLLLVSQVGSRFLFGLTLSLGGVDALRHLLLV